MPVLEAPVSDIALIAVGLALLGAGAELLVRCGASVAARLGVSPLPIGLTIVAFGTSAPEAVAGVTASLRGSSGIAVDNIVGSNIVNSLLVAGAAALVAPMAVAKVALSKDGVVALLSAAAVWLVSVCRCSMQGHRWRCCWLCSRTWFLPTGWRRTHRPLAPSVEGAARGGTASLHDRGARRSLLAPVAGAILGSVLLAGGGHLLVASAINLANGLGVSEAAVGLTIVAVGTSLPELATSLRAARRGETAIAFGNVVDSNIFNAPGIGGLTAIWSKDDVPSRILIVDFPIMLAATALLLLVAVTGRRVGCIEGAPG